MNLNLSNLDCLKFTVVMKLVILLGIITYQIIISVSQNDTQCIENPTGEVSLNVAVRGVPGPEGPQGPKGDIGPKGEEGSKGDHGVQGEKGDHGVIGPKGAKGTKGDEGRKGQKGANGPEGKLGPQGSPGLVGPRGSRGPPGHEGPEGPEGLRGQIGHPGPRGLQGEPGDTVLNDEEFDRVTKGLHNSIFSNVSTSVSKAIDTVQQKILSLNITLLDTMMSELRAMNETLNILNSKFYSLSLKCGIFGYWRTIAHFDTTVGDSCPTGLRTVKNTSTKQTACGRTVNRGCTSLQFLANGTYTNVCGRVRGYQYYRPESFYTGTNSIDSPYLHGVSITHGTPRTHLWSYVAGLTEQYSTISYRCPCARPDPTDRSGVPSFVGEHFYCESGFSGSNYENKIAWEDPLWDGQGCFASGNQCCNRYGWFHREIPTTSDNIEVRWCAEYILDDEDVLTDQLEIWVM